MSVGSGCVTLVAMPRSAETFLARDASGTLWLVPPVGAGTSEIVADSAVDEAVRIHNWDRIDAAFDTWQELDDERQRRAAVLAEGRYLGIEDYDAEDVQRLVTGAEARQATGDIRAARTILHRLLRDVRLLDENAALRKMVINRLVDLDNVSPTPPRRDVAGIRPENRGLAQRLDLLAA